MQFDSEMLEKVVKNSILKNSDFFREEVYQHKLHYFQRISSGIFHLFYLYIRVDFVSHFIFKEKNSNSVFTLNTLATHQFSSYK